MTAKAAPMSDRLVDAQANGVYQITAEPYQLERAAQEAGLAIFRIDIGHAHGKKDFLAHIAKAMRFPDWFGGNWDALNDCLTDLDWLAPAAGFIIVFEKSRHFGVAHKIEFDEAVTVFSAAGEYWKDEHRPFWAFFHGAQGWDSGLPRWPGA